MARTDFINFTVEMLGEKQVDLMLGVAAKKVDDLRPAWKPMREIWHRNRLFDFREEGGHGGSGWAKLDPAYAASKAAKYPGNTILRREDRLFESLTSESGADRVWIPSRLRLEFGTATSYAIYHQLGTPDMPQRRPVQINEAEARTYTSPIQVHLFETDQLTRVNL